MTKDLSFITDENAFEIFKAGCHRVPNFNDSLDAYNVFSSNTNLISIERRANKGYSAEEMAIFKIVNGRIIVEPIQPDVKAYFNYGKALKKAEVLFPNSEYMKFDYDWEKREQEARLRNRTTNAGPNAG